MVALALMLNSAKVRRSLRTPLYTEVNSSKG